MNVTEARKLLREAMHALNEEVMAASGDDHPTIKEHGEIADRIQRFLESGQ